MANVTRNIELRQLVGLTDDRAEVRYALDEIFLNGVRAGFVGHGAQEPINLIRPGIAGDLETVAEIRQAIQKKLRGGERRVYGVPELADQERLDFAEGIVTHRDEEE